jgi:hypothetical protein
MHILLLFCNVFALQDLALAQEFIDDFGPLYQEFVQVYGTDEPFYEAMEQGFQDAVDVEYDEDDYDGEESYEPLLDILDRFQLEFDQLGTGDSHGQYEQQYEQDNDYHGELQEYENMRVPQAQPIFFIFILAAKAIAIAVKAAAAAKGDSH